MTDNTVRGTVATRSNERPTVGQFITRLQPEIQRALPKHMDGDRMARLALTEVRKNPKLGECIPESFAGAILTAAAIGVEVGTPEAYLVPYKRECTLIIGYQGYTKLFWQHPQAQSLNAQAVHEADEFDYAYGLAPKLHHKPATGERGKIIFYYAAVSLSTGGQHFEVLTPEQVKELRNGKVGGNGGIGDPMHWMERKTAIRQVLKPMPKSTQMSQAVEADERDGSSLYMERVAENAVGSGTAAIENTPQGVDTATGEVTNPRAGGWDDADGADPSNDGIWPDENAGR
jgi:recombination protein RecT